MMVKDIDESQAPLLDHLLELPSLAEQWYAIEARWPGGARDRLLRELVRGQIGRMVNDVLEETRAQIGVSGVDSADAVRAAGARAGGDARSQPAILEVPRRRAAVAAVAPP